MTPGGDSNRACGTATSTCAGSFRAITHRTTVTELSWHRRPNARKASGKSWRRCSSRNVRRRVCSTFPRYRVRSRRTRPDTLTAKKKSSSRSEEHTSELQSHHDLVCRLLLEKKKKKK